MLWRKKKFMGFKTQNFLSLSEGRRKPKSWASPRGWGRWLRAPLGRPRGPHTAHGWGHRHGRGMLEATKALQSSPPRAWEHFVTSGYKHLEIIKNQRRCLNVLIK